MPSLFSSIGGRLKRMFCIHPPSWLIPKTDLHFIEFSFNNKKEAKKCIMGSDFFFHLKNSAPHFSKWSPHPSSFLGILGGGMWLALEDDTAAASLPLLSKSLHVLFHSHRGNFIKMFPIISLRWDIDSTREFSTHWFCPDLGKTKDPLFKYVSNRSFWQIDK